MKALVVYDSAYGSTQKIAEAIGGAISAETRVVRASQVDRSGLGSVDLLIVGSPTQGGRPLQPVQDFLARIPEAAVKGLKVATFDTRYEGRFVKVFGFAAERIAQSLEAKGGVLVAPPQPFIVKGKKGPIKDGELERAARWGKEVAR